MISLDTNVLVRILVEDDARQTARARALVKRLEAAGETAHVADIVLCELVWVLQSCYGLDRAVVAAAVSKLTAAKQLLLDRPGEIASALRAFENGRGDFADYLIREVAKRAGCESVVTFDRALLAEAFFVAP
jgi:predicted nucleic-acid-binding protein